MHKINILSCPFHKRVSNYLLLKNPFEKPIYQQLEVKRQNANDIIISDVILITTYDMGAKTVRKSCFAMSPVWHFWRLFRHISEHTKAKQTMPCKQIADWVAELRPRATWSRWHRDFCYSAGHDIRSGSAPRCDYHMCLTDFTLACQLGTIM